MHCANRAMSFILGSTRRSTRILMDLLAGRAGKFSMRLLKISYDKIKPNRPMHLTPMPSALLARRLRSRLWCQKQVGAGDRGRSRKKEYSREVSRQSGRRRDGGVEQGTPPETQNEGFRDDRPESSGENLEMNLSEQRKMSGIRPHQKVLWTTDRATSGIDDRPFATANCQFAERRHP